MFHLGRNKSNVSGPARVRISARSLSGALLKEPGARAPHGFLLHLQNAESSPTRDPRAGITAFVQNRGDQPCSKARLSAHIQLTRRLRSALLTRGSSQDPAARWHFKEGWEKQGTEPQQAASLRASAGPQKGEGDSAGGRGRGEGAVATAGPSARSSARPRGRPALTQAPAPQVRGPPAATHPGRRGPRPSRAVPHVPPRAAGRAGPGHRSALPRGRARGVKAARTRGWRDGGTRGALPGLALSLRRAGARTYELE